MALADDGLQATFHEIIELFKDRNTDLLPTTVVASAASDDLLVEDQRQYTLYIEGYDGEYLKNIEDAVKSIPAVIKADFVPEGVNLWRAEILGSFKSDEDFAESLYISGLTYRNRTTGKGLNLIKLDRGA